MRILTKKVEYRLPSPYLAEKSRYWHAQDCAHLSSCKQLEGRKSMNMTKFAILK